ncbi:MAG: YbfB/YjiJ family MFS transporter [Myxococcota bacterium]
MKTHPFYAPLAGFCMIGIGLCLCRYAYTPLIPSLVDHGWVTKAGAGYLSGFNCLGYLLGCVAALFLPARVGVRRLLQWSLVFAVAGQVMSAWNLGFAYLAFARAVTGMAGASLVILTPSLVLPHVTEGWKKVVSGICFTGAGAAIVMVSLLLPTFTAMSVTAGWLFEAGLTFGFAALAWRLVSEAPRTSAETGLLSIPPRAKGAGFSLGLLGTAYFLAAIGVTPHMLFLTDYLYRDLGVGVAESSRLFSLVGIGSLVGALSSGVIARWIGTKSSLILNYLLGSAAVAVVLLTVNVTLITISAFTMGFFLFCCVTLSSIGTGEISGLPRHPRDWGVLTLGFGAGLALGSYGLSGLLSLGASYYMLFVIAEGVLAVAFALASWLALRGPAPTPAS